MDLCLHQDATHHSSVIFLCCRLLRLTLSLRSLLSGSLELDDLRLFLLSLLLRVLDDSFQSRAVITISMESVKRSDQDVSSHLSVDIVQSPLDRVLRLELLLF